MSTTEIGNGFANGFLWVFVRRSKALPEGRFHGTPPYGYDKVKGRLVPNVTHAPTVKLIFDLYLRKGMGMQAIANYLTDKKVPTPRAVLGAKNAGTVWQQSAVKLILTNPHYTGDLVQGRSKTDIKDKAFNQEKGYKKRLQVNKENWINWKRNRLNSPGTWPVN